MKNKENLISPVYFKLLFLLLCFPVMGFGQATSKCFSFERIKKMHNSSFIEINSMLYQENWGIVVNTNETPFVFGEDTVMYDNFSQWKFELSVDKLLVSLYRKKDMSSVVVLQTSKTCYEAIESDLQKRTSVIRTSVDRSSHHINVYHILKGMDIIFSSQKNRQPYHIIICNYQQLDSLIKVQNAEKEEYEEILRTQREFIQTSYFKADSLQKFKDYESAIRVLNQVIEQPFANREEFAETIYDIQDKIDDLKREYNLKLFNTHIQAADRAFSNEKFAEAKTHLLKAQKIDSMHHDVLKKIKEIELIESMLLVRKDSVFNYSLYNKSESEAVRSFIFNRLQKYIMKMSSGDILFSYTLKTDTLKNNLSFYQVDRFTLNATPKLISQLETKETWSQMLDSLLVLRSLPAVKINNLYVNAETDFQNQLSWNVSFDKVYFGGKKIKILPRKMPPMEKTIIENYFSGNDFLPNGEYTIEKKKVMYQDRSFSALSLKRFYSVGPEAMVYSMLYPGAGSLAATHGKKGWGALSTFTVFTGLAVTSIVIAKSFKPGTAKDALTYTSYGLFGVSGVIYICDMFIALKRGIDNMKKTQVLKSKLENNTIFIQDFPQQIEY